MGFDTNGIKFLLYATKSNIRFGKTLTLGRQSYQLEKKLFSAILKENNFSSSEVDDLSKTFTYVEPFLLKLGASKIDSMDASSYESATVIHDLNTPIPETLKGQYDTVVDAGTLEHVFNFPTAIKNCMEMVKPGGHFIGITCSNNFPGHGFYQFSPELYYRIFSEENGFETKKLFLVVHEESDHWYTVPDPKDRRKRLIFENSKPTFLYIIAKKTAEKQIFSHTPQQSDYEFLAWQGKDQFEKKKKKFFQRILFFLPDYVKTRVRNRLRILDPRAWKIFLKDMGNGDENEFKRTPNK
jgi:SAM-dependent methyltransferase